MDELTSLADSTSNKYASGRNHTVTGYKLDGSTKVWSLEPPSHGNLDGDHLVTNVVLRCFEANASFSIVMLV